MDGNIHHKSKLRNKLGSKRDRDYVPVIHHKSAIDETVAHAPLGVLQPLVSVEGCQVVPEYGGQGDEGSGNWGTLNGL